MRLFKGVSGVGQMVECLPAGKVGHQGRAGKAQGGSDCARVAGAEGGVPVATGDPREVED